MSIDEDIVIVGAGIAGLSTALGLHRMGLSCLVLESSESLRTTGFALTLWTNAWKALDAIGVGESLRKRTIALQGAEILSLESNESGSNKPQRADFKGDNVESRCVIRKDLLETLEKELPEGTIRYSSKLVAIEESGNFKLVHLADGSVVKTKVLIGCDGVYSIVAKYLGLQDPIHSGRSMIRGFAHYPNGHEFEPMYHLYFGGGVRCGYTPCGENHVYWFCNFPTILLQSKEGEDEENPFVLKQFVASRILNASGHLSSIVEITELESISVAPLKYRSPLNILLGNLIENNISVAGDALHPMTPDIGQGGCSSLEDGVVLARCLGEALLNKEKDEKDVNLENGLQRYVKERRWRSFALISTALVVGMIEQSNSKVIGFMRKKFLSKYTVGATMKMTRFDCGKLEIVD